MNVNTDYSVNQGNFANRAANGAGASTAGGVAPQEATPFGDTADIVEISQDSRDALASQKEAEASAEAARQAERKEAVGYTADDVAGLKARFSALTKMEKDVDGRINSLLGKKGIQINSDESLKIEIDSRGRAIVGGIKDVKKAREIERAINSDTKLLEDITAYQKEEKQISRELKEVTGVGLGDFAARINHLQGGGAIDKVLQDTGDPKGNYTAEQAIGLQDQELFLVDEEFAGMISSHYASKKASVTFTGENNILENAGGVVNNAMRDMITMGERAFDLLNQKIEDDASRLPPEDRAEFLDRSYVKMNRLNITVDNEGKVVIEGTANKDNPDYDRKAKELIENIINEELKANPVTGQQHDFMIASTYLLNTYDEAFGADSPLGLGDDSRTLETTYDRGAIESHVNSPEREEELAVEIDKSAKDALKDMNIDASDLEIEVNDDGKLAAKNLSPEDPKFQQIQSALELLNSQVEDRSMEDAKNQELAMNPVKRLKGLMANLDTFQPGGASELNRDEETRDKPNKADEAAA